MAKVRIIPSGPALFLFIHVLSFVSDEPLPLSPRSGFSLLSIPEGIVLHGKSLSQFS
jgi:hypothetical protein